MSSVLFILTGATSWTQKDGSQRASGFWGEEFVVPHQIFSNAGVSITIATPEGSPAVVDGLSLSPEANNGDTAKVAAISAYLNLHGSALRAPARLRIWMWGISTQSLFRAATVRCKTWRSMAAWAKFSPRR
jgi:hypothetical protein